MDIQIFFGVDDGFKGLNVLVFRQNTIAQYHLGKLNNSADLALGHEVLSLFGQEHPFKFRHISLLF